MPGDSRSALERAETFVPDQRAIHFWDVYFLYGPQAIWDETPSPALSWGGTVIDMIGDLRMSLSFIWGN